MSRAPKKLDIGCGNMPQPGYLGLDRKAYSTVTYIHDIEIVPWPIADSCFDEVRAYHILEHVKPWMFMDVVKEVYRILVPHGLFRLQVPYGVNHLFVQDPTHCNPMNEHTMQYFDPRSLYYEIYHPAAKFNIVEEEIDKKTHLTQVLRKVP